MEVVVQEDQAPTTTRLSLTIVPPTAITLEKNIKLQKKGLKIKIYKRGHKTKLKHNRPSSCVRNKLNMELSKRSIAALVSALASQARDLEGTEPTSDTEIKDGEDKKSVKRQKSNHTNKALTRSKN